MTTDLQLSIDHAMWCLEEYDKHHSPSATGYNVEQIGQKHQLRQSMERLLTEIPAGDWRDEVLKSWNLLLKLATDDDDDAPDAADDLWDVLDRKEP